MLHFDLNAVSSGGHLHVSGHATLAGTVRLDAGSGSASAPMTLTLIEYGSRSGTFEVYDLPALSYGVWEARYDDPEDTFTLWALETGA